MKKSILFVSVILTNIAFGELHAAEYQIFATSKIQPIKEEAVNPNREYVPALPITDFKQNMRPSGYRVTGGTFDYTTKVVDQGGYLRVVNGVASVEDTSAYPWQGAGLIAETTLVADLNDTATYYLSLFATAKLSPAFGADRSTPGLSYISLSATCSGYSGNSARTDGTPYTGRTNDGGWLPKETIPFELKSAGFPSTSFTFTKNQCPDGRIKVRVVMEGKKIEFNGIEAALSEAF